MSQCKVPLPTTDDKYLGIELEMRGDRHAGHECLFSKMPEFTKSVVVNWESFGSVSGWEAKFLVREVDVERLLPTFIETLVAAGLTADNYCGLHVHVDCRERDRNEVRGRIEAAYVPLFAFCSSNRARAAYAMCLHRDYETIECRLMEANFDTPRILKYIKKLVEVVDAPALAAAA